MQMKEREAPTNQYAGRERRIGKKRPMCAGKVRAKLQKGNKSSAYDSPLELVHAAAMHSVLLAALAMPVVGHSVTSHLDPLAAAPTIHLAVIIRHSKLSDLEDLRLYNVNFRYRYRAARELKWRIVVIIRYVAMGRAFLPCSEHLLVYPSFVRCPPEI
jgi:hypothetical protein